MCHELNTSHKTHTHTIDVILDAEKYDLDPADSSLPTAGGGGGGGRGNSSRDNKAKAPKTGQNVSK